jgi:hypothetical protein
MFKHKVAKLFFFSALSQTFATLSGDSLHAKLLSLKLEVSFCGVTDDDVFLGMIVQLKCRMSGSTGDSFAFLSLWKVLEDIFNIEMVQRHTEAFRNN